MINLASGLGMPTQQPSIWNALQGDCCSVPSVHCVGLRVTEIYWSTKSLIGTINETALPSSLTLLFLKYNQITGRIPKVLPDGILELYLQGNILTDAIPRILPADLQGLFLFGNQLNGTIPTLPLGLVFLSLYSNMITGNIPSLPNTLTHVDLSHNQLEGNIPSPCPSGLQQLHLHDNFLDGNLPMFSILLENLWLGYPGTIGNRFSGTLVLNKPTQVYINYNLITDVVIQNISVLTACDLSNNPLLGNTNIVKLSMCDKYKLFQISTTFALNSDISLLSVQKYNDNESTTIGLVLISRTQLGLKLEELIKMIFKLFLNIVVLVSVLHHTPFKREWKAKANQKKETNKLLL